MVQQSLNIAYSDGSSQVLWEDGERVFSRGWRLDDNGNRLAVLLVAPAADHPSRSRLDRLAHEYELKDELDGAWAARPLDLVRDGRSDRAGARGSGRRAARPAARRAHGDGSASCASRSASPQLWARCTSAVSSTRTSSRPIFWSTARTGQVWLTGFRHRVAPVRASGSRPSRPSPSPGRSPTWRPSRPGG